jgi:hypothetical protein
MTFVCGIDEAEECGTSFLRGDQWDEGVARYDDRNAEQYGGHREEYFEERSEPVEKILKRERERDVVRMTRAENVTRCDEPLW